MSDQSRGFSTGEFRSRLHRAQEMMAAVDVSALLLTTEAEIRYFTGFLTRFWESPARPWMLVVPASGDPIAVIPSIGAALMAQTWITDIRTWRSPNPTDEGISLIVETLREVVGNGRVGVPDGSESHLRLPLASWRSIEQQTPGIELTGDHGIMRRLRVIKSAAEIAKIEASCRIGDAAFARVGEIAHAGVPLDEVFRRFQMLCLEEGADWVPYLAGASDTDGYADVISPATGAPLGSGDILMLDTGLVRDGYFCDFDRNFAVDTPSDKAASAHSRLLDAVGAGFEVARPGATAADIFHAMDAIVAGASGGSDVGRLGHGLGMQLTEWPSLIAEDATVIRQGMVLTLEPSIEVAPGVFLVHEENIAIGEDGPRYLTSPSSRELPVI